MADDKFRLTATLDTRRKTRAYLGILNCDRTHLHPTVGAELHLALLREFKRDYINVQPPNYVYSTTLYAMLRYRQERTRSPTVPLWSRTVARAAPLAYRRG